LAKYHAAHLRLASELKGRHEEIDADIALSKGQKAARKGAVTRKFNAQAKQLKADMGLLEESASSEGSRDLRSDSAISSSESGDVSGLLESGEQGGEGESGSFEPGEEEESEAMSSVAEEKPQKLDKVWNAKRRAKDTKVKVDAEKGEVKKKESTTTGYRNALNFLTEEQGPHVVKLLQAKSTIGKDGGTIVTQYYPKMKDLDTLRWEGKDKQEIFTPHWRTMLKDAMAEAYGSLSGDYSDIYTLNNILVSRRGDQLHVKFIEGGKKEPFPKGRRAMSREQRIEYMLSRFYAGDGAIFAPK
jgi:hypothetical protein